MKKEYIALLLAVIIVGVFFVGPHLFAIVLSGGHIGSITAGETTTFNLDTCVFADKQTVTNGKIWFRVTDLSETQAIYSSQPQTINLDPGQCATYEFIVSGTTTGSWIPGEYKMLVETTDSQGIDLPLEGSINDPRYIEEGGVAWQFTVLEGQVNPPYEPPPVEPPVTQPIDPLVIIAIIIMIIIAIVLGLLFVKR